MKMNSEPIMEIVENACLPEDLRVGISVTEWTDGEMVGAEIYRRREKGYGRKLLAGMASRFLGEGNFRVEARDGEKPLAYFEECSVEVSISHCPGLCGAALSVKRSVGIDLEHSRRKVNKALRERILASEEEVLCSQLPVLQIWTVKESALKWCGTGLRHPMNRLSIVNVDGSRLTVRLKDGNLAECCSFRVGEYWLAVTFDTDRKVVPGI